MYYLFDTVSPRTNAIILHVEEDRIVLNEREHSLYDIKARSDFRPYCKFVYPLKQTSIDQRVIEDSLSGKHSYPYSQNPFDVFSYTSESKLSQHEVEQLILSSTEVSFLFYPNTKNFKDAVLTILKSSDTNVPLKVTTLDENKNIIDYVPDKVIKDNITSVAPKCTLEVVETKTANRLPVSIIEFTYNDLEGNFIECDFPAYVKASCGYISHRKIYVKNGKARFKYIPMGVESGEKSQIQVGIGKYSIVTKILEV